MVLVLMLTGPVLLPKPPVLMIRLAPFQVQARKASINFILMALQGFRFFIVAEAQLGLPVPQQGLWQGKLLQLICNARQRELVP